MNVPTPAPRPILVFDASALVAWLAQSNGRWKRIHQLLTSSADCVLPAQALTEAIYVARRHGNTSTAAQITAALVGHGLRIEPVTADDGERAGVIIAESEKSPAIWVNGKGEPREGALSLGDGLTLAVTQRLNGHAVTFDQAWCNFPTQTFRLIDPWKIKI